MHASSTTRILFMLCGLSAACDPVVYSGEGTYKVTDIAMLDADGKVLGALTTLAAPGTSVLIDSSIELRYFGAYQMSAEVKLVVTPPFGLGPELTTSMPYDDSGDWTQLSDTEIRLDSKDGSSSKAMLEGGDSRRIRSIVPTTKFGTFPPPFTWMNDKSIQLRLEKVAAER